MTDKRTAILETTLKLISARGFHDTPMSLIAADAGVGTGTIYRYFENKEALINELFLELKREMSQAMLVGYAGVDTTEAKFRRVWRNTFQYCIDNPEAMIFLEQYHNSPFLTSEAAEATMGYLAPIVDTFRAAIRTGEIKEMPFEMLSAFAYDLTVAHAKRHISGILVMDEDLLEMAVQACWDAIKAV